MISPTGITVVNSGGAGMIAGSSNAAKSLGFRGNTLIRVTDLLAAKRSVPAPGCGACGNEALSIESFRSKQRLTRATGGIRSFPEWRNEDSRIYAAVLVGARELDLIVSAGLVASRTTCSATLPRSMRSMPL